MNRFLKGLLSGVTVWLANQVRVLSLDLIKVKAACWYIEGVRAARRAYLQLVVTILCLMLAGAGFILIHVGLFALLPQPVNAIVLIALGGLYTLVGLCIIGRLGSEKTWMRMAKAERFKSPAGSREKCWPDSPAGRAH
jgi:hypothetical protein